MPLRNCHCRLQLLPFLALIIGPAGAIADVTVQEQLSLRTPNLRTQWINKQSLAGDKERSDLELRCEGSSACDKNQRTDITRLDREAAWAIEPAKRAFTETLFKTRDQRRAVADQLKAPGQNSCPQSQPGSLIDPSKCELSSPKWSVEKTNETATVAGYEAQLVKIQLTRSCTSNDPKQTCELVYAYDAWFSREEVPALNDRRSFQDRYFAHLGLTDSSLAVFSQFSPYLARYSNEMIQLSQKAGELKGYPLKATFRLTFTGKSCNSGPVPSALSGAGQSAAQSTRSSAEYAAGWGTTDAVERSTGSTVGSYVAGNAVGSFAGSLVGGLFAKKAKPQVNSAAAGDGALPVTTLAEFAVETILVSTDVIPASEFELPSGLTKVAAGQIGSANCSLAAAGKRQ
jgi:hypothetical protein